MFPAFFLVLAAILVRVIPPLMHVHHDWMSNFSPIAAIVFCGALFFPKKLALWVSIAALLISDLVLNTFVYARPLFTWDILPRYLAFLAIGALTFHFQKKIAQNVGSILVGSVAASLFFYLLTNTGSWLGDSGYAKNVGGWLQSVTVGLPGYRPTWMFFRNSLISDLLFTGLFLVAMFAGASKQVKHLAVGTLESAN